MSKQRILITGISGFVGSHLADYLLTKRNIEVFGVDISAAKVDNLENCFNKVKLFPCDLTDGEAVRKLFKEIKPEKVFHLAGHAFVGDSWSNPQKTFTVNVFGELNIFNALVELKLNPRVQIACSSEEYGLASKNELPISENNELRPL